MKPFAETRLTLIQIWIAISYRIHVAGPMTLPPEDNLWDSYGRDVNEFCDLLETDYYVDKTNIILSFFETIRIAKFQLITAPPKFGKTVMLKMMQKFLQIDRECLSEKTEGSSYKLFAYSGKKLAIAPYMRDTTSLIYQYLFHRYVVIYISFKSEPKQVTKEQIINSLIDSIKRCYEYFGWVFVVLIRRFEIEGFDPDFENMMAITEKVYNRNITEEEIPHCLPSLMKLLDKFHKRRRRIVWLIDDYDRPIVNAINDGYHANWVNNLMSKIYEQLLDIPHVGIKYVILAGTSYFLDRARFIHIKHFNFLDHHFYKSHFGFTDNEVTKLYSRFDINQSEIDTVKAHYDGYYTNLFPIRLYNPYSLVSHLQDRLLNGVNAFKGYWTNESQTQKFLILHKPKEITRRKINRLMRPTGTQFKLKKIFSVKDVDELSVLSFRNFKAETFPDDLFYSYLYNLGFCTYGKNSSYFRIPNMEIRNFLRALYPADQF